MARQPDTVTVLPSAKRLVESLRDVGYDFVGAVADLVDNSVAANASRVDVTLSWDGPDIWLRIADNGTGMDSTTITEALRFGSERSYRMDDLGKFGLGLKTASLSQCRQILVASRMSEQIARLEARRFDLGRILRENKWEVEILAGADRPRELVEPLREHPGTVVVWAQLDRLLGTRVPHSERAKASFFDLADRLERHLGMVFHRFIEGDLPGRKRQRLVITLNDNIVRPWNPFAASEPHTQHLQVRDVDIAVAGSSGVVTFDPWVLPARDKFSSESEFNALSGPLKWNQQQGFYVYRANRMIQSGGWSRMRTADEHTKLARVALDFYPELDAAFSINIAKMRVSLPSQLRERLKEPIEDLIRTAKRAYDPKADKGLRARSAVPAVALGAGRSTLGAKPKPSVPIVPPTGPDPGPTSLHVGGDLSWPPPPLIPTSRPGESLVEAARATGDSEALERIKKHVQENNPEVARVLGW